MISAEDASKIVQDSNKPFFPEETKTQLADLIKNAASQGKKSLTIRKVYRSFLSYFIDEAPELFIGDELIQGDLSEIKHFLISHGYTFTESVEKKEYIFSW